MMYVNLEDKTFELSNSLACDRTVARGFCFLILDEPRRLSLSVVRPRSWVQMLWRRCR